MSRQGAQRDSERDTFALCGDFVEELRDASPRAKAIVAASALDEILARFLEKQIEHTKTAKRLIRRPYAPLGTFSARTDAAFGLHLISKNQYDALNVIREVRNSFSHRVNCAFDDPDIEKLCLRLDIENVVYPPGEEGNPQTRYLMNASAICGQLDGLFRLWEVRGDHPSVYLDGY